MVQYFGIILLPLNPVYYYSEIYDPVLKQWKQCGIFLIYSWITGYQPACEKTSMTFHDFLHFAHSLIPTFFSFFFFLLFLCNHEKDESFTAIHIYAVIFSTEPKVKIKMKQSNLPHDLCISNFSKRKSLENCKLTILKSIIWLIGLRFNNNCIQRIEPWEILGHLLLLIILGPSLVKTNENFAFSLNPINTKP